MTALASFSSKALRRSAYLLGLVVAASGTAAVALGGSTSALSPGPLSGGHARLAEDCASCHEVSFAGLRAMRTGSRASTMNGACLDCHGHTIGADAIALHVSHGVGTRAEARMACSDCHRQHRSGADPRAAAEEACVRCHTGTEPAITSLADHREFAPAAGSDPGTLQFDHALHRAQGLSCADCHRTRDAGERGHRLGQYQAPVEFARDCQRCHSLDVPHAATHAGDAACAKCHRVQPPSGPTPPSIAPVQVRQRWYPSSHFDHGRHTAVAFGRGAGGGDAQCAVCHGSMLTSARSADVGVPGVAVCRQCHGAEQGASDRCATCHVFHLPPSAGATDYEALDAELVAAGKRETRYGLRSGAALWPLWAFFELPRAVWGLPELVPGTPAFERELFKRYGLFPADFANDGLPLGLLRVEDEFDDGTPGMTVTCELCHSSALLGRVVVGQPNRFSNIEQLWRDLGAVSGEAQEDPLYYKNPPNNTVVNGADHLGLLGLMLRNPDLSADLTTALRIAYEQAPDLKPEFDALAYIKTPPWYTYRTKQGGTAAYYFDGGHPKDANFAAFTYLTTFRDLDGEDLRSALSAWQRSGHVFLASLEAPPYPFAIDRERAARGRAIYDDVCSGCHGRYEGEARAANLRYPGLVVPASEVGTDALRARFPASFGERMSAILRERYVLTGGYVAQPLTAIWAQAPYLHNGSVPTLAQLLEPTSRVGRYALVADPNEPKDFDQQAVGWRTEPAPAGPVPVSARVYDPALVPGLGNRGHDYGAELTPEERAELIEFLKTL